MAKPARLNDHHRARACRRWSPAGPPVAGASGVVAWYAEGFSDALGDRLRLFDNAGPRLNCSDSAPPWASCPGSRRPSRAHQRADHVQPSCLCQGTGLTQLDDLYSATGLASELVTGERLSTVLRAAEARGARLDPTCAIWLLRHLLPALPRSADARGRPAPSARRRPRHHDAHRRDRDHWVRLRRVVGSPAPAPLTTDVGQAAGLAIAVLLSLPRHGH